MGEIDPDILAALDPHTLLAAYAQGAFPMVEDGQLLWFSPQFRGLLPMDGSLHVPRSLRRTIRRGRFDCTLNHCFERVVRLCGEREEGTWISPEMAAAYAELHRRELAVSFETWRSGQVGEGDPAGGLYGVALGRAFFGESMFHRVTDAGKVALVASVEFLRARGFTLYDVQWLTPHLARFGAFEAPREEYLERLADALDGPGRQSSSCSRM